MKTAGFVVDVSRQFLDAMGKDFVEENVVIPTEVIGPRGGRYKPIGPWTIEWSDVPRWDMNLVSVRYTSPVRYIRPKKP